MAVVIDPATKVKELTIGSQSGNPSTFILTDTSLYVNRPTDTKWPQILVPLRYVLWAESTDGSVELSLLARKSKKKKGPLSLVHISGKLDPAQQDEVAQFTQLVMEAAYRGVKRQRHVLVLVNPIAGPGKAKTHLAKRILPILKAAHCTQEVIVTTHYKHAWEVARELPLGKFDVIAAVSGDGIIHEITNGLAEHKEPIRALETPLSPIPAGSGNALSLNLLGMEEGFDISAATLNVIKGLPMKIDLCSFTQKDKRVLSFLSQAIGLMAELDIGTEHLRFMGDSRFMYGYLRGLIRHKACPVKISIKVVQSDKIQMLKDLRAGEEAAARRIEAARLHDNQSMAANGDSSQEQELDPSSSSLPPLKYQSEHGGEGWLEFDKEVLYMYAGKGPLVARDLMQFPMSLPDDGYVDVVIQERYNRKAMIKAIDGADVGKAYWLDTQHYFKAEAYRVEPLAPSSCVSIDGEAYPFEPFQVEVHKGLGTLLSPYGVYNVKFSVEDERKPS